MFEAPAVSVDGDRSTSSKRRLLVDPVPFLVLPSLMECPAPDSCN